MEKVKENKEYSIFKKRSGRYAVMNNTGSYIRGPEKEEILKKEKLIKVSQPKKKEEASEETPAQE